MATNGKFKKKLEPRGRLRFNVLEEVDEIIFSFFTLQRGMAMLN